MQKKLFLVLLVGLGAVLACSCKNNPTVPTPSGPAFSLVSPFTFSILGTPGPGSANGQFHFPTDIAFDNNGNIYVMDNTNQRVQKFDKNGNYLLNWGPVYGWGIATDNNGYVYVTGASTNMVYKYNSMGTTVTQWGGTGSANGQFNDPEGISVDQNSNVYVSENTGNGSGVGDRIQKFDSNGNFILKWGTPGAGNGQFNRPSQVAVDNNGNLYVVDSDNYRIQKFDSNGNYLLQWGGTQFSYPVGVAVDGNSDVYVVDYGIDQIDKFDSVGNFIIRWGSFGSGYGQYNNPVFARVDQNNNVYIADEYNNRVEETTYPYGLVSVNTFGLFPNPVKGGQFENFEFNLKGIQNFLILIKDFQGNPVNQYQGQGLNGTNILKWNLVNSSGNLINSGAYFAVFNSSGTAVTQSFTCAP